MSILIKVRNIIITAVVISLSAFAQTPVPSPVSLQVGIGLGNVSPKSDFGGSITDYYLGTKYGQSGGIDYQVKARIGIIGFNLVGQMDYASLSNNGYVQQIPGTIDISQKILSFKIGPEFKFSIPLFPVTPYIGANIAFNRFSGSVSIQSTVPVSNAEYSIKGDSRIGYGISGGVIVNLMGLTLDIGAQYNVLNAFGKKFDPGQGRYIDSYLALNDAPDPAYHAPGNFDHFIKSSRTLSTFAITATVMFGL